MADRFLISPVTVGLQTDVKPFLLPNNAFSRLTNAYVSHGIVKKRFSSYLMDQSIDSELQPMRSRLRVLLGTTSGAGALAGTVPGAIFKIGQMFSAGSEAYTVDALGAPATILSTGSGSMDYNTTTGAYSLTGGPATTAVYFYPTEPVMGIHTYQVSDVNDEFTIAFDTQLSYFYVSGGGWDALDFAVVGNIWTGSDAQFFWAENYRGIQAYEGYIFVTNFNVSDGIRYYDATNWTQMSNASLTYDAAGNYIETARLILSFKGRLLLFNTQENVTAVSRSFPNRVRYCQVGDPITAGNNPWREDIGGKGGFIDAPTTEAIISARIMKDRLIVYFENSTFELVYTGNQELPFIWQQINSELGVESTFSTITFDRSIIGIGQNGVHACNGAYVNRIDDVIQDEVFMIKNIDNGLERVYGIRDFFAQLVYWAIPDGDNPSYFPNRILVYNYENETWAFFEDSITAFGYYQPPADAQDLPGNFRHILAGNQQGFMFICDTNKDDNQVSQKWRNAPSLQISSLAIGVSTTTMTVVDNNLQDGDFVLIENAQGITGLNGNIYEVTVGVGDNIVIDAVPTGTYTGLGTMARVSRIDILTKQYNFYSQQGRNASINSVGFFVDRTATGEITVDFRPDSTTVNATTNILETFPFTALYPLEASQDQLWHYIYPTAEGNLIQFRIYLSDAQMADPDISLMDFQMNAIMFSANPTSNRLQ